MLADRDGWRQSASRRDAEVRICEVRLITPHKRASRRWRSRFGRIVGYSEKDAFDAETAIGLLPEESYRYCR